MKRRHLISHLLASPLLATLPLRSVRAQAFPSRPIKLIVPYPAGGPSDRVCRLVAEIAGNLLGQRMTVFNQPGASGTLGLVNTVIPARPDGYTLGAYFNAMLRIPVLQNVSWHPINDFSFIAGVYQSTGHAFGLVVRADSPYRSFAGLREAALKQPGTITYGSSGMGSGGHVLVERLAEAAGIRLIHVPFKGSTDMIPALQGGHVDMICDLAGGWDKFVEDRSLRLLLTFGDRPSSAWQHVPTAKSLGYGIVAYEEMGIVGPAGMDAAVLETLQSVFKAAVVDSRFVEVLHQQYRMPWTANGAQFKALAIERFGSERAILRRLGLSVS